MLLHRVIKLFYNEIIRKYSIVKRYVFFTFATWPSRMEKEVRAHKAASLSIHDIPATSGRVPKSKSNANNLLRLHANVSPRFPPFGPHLSLESPVEAERKSLPVDFLGEFRVLHTKNLFYDREKFQSASPSILHRPLFPWKNTI